VGEGLELSGVGEALGLAGVGEGLELSGVGDAVGLAGVGEGLELSGVGEALGLSEFSDWGSAIQTSGDLRHTQSLSGTNSTFND
jgi:hypothetical protein